jgi:alpha-N-acetylglucosaminidase
MEGSENNPVMFELMSELPWRPEKFTKEAWVKDYVKARYGVEDEAIEQAWMILVNSIYNCPAGNNQQGPHESIFCGRPSLNNFQASSWSKMKNYYDPADTKEAARLMNSVAEKYAGNSNFEYDLVDITRQALADQARQQYQHTIADYKGFDRQRFDKDAARFLEMLLMQDKLLGTRAEFRLGHWTQDAINAGTTAAEKKLYEWNARVQITTWGNRYCADTGGLRDYAHKEWQGLLKDFYYPRWKAYFEALAAQMKAQTAPQPELLGGGPNATKTAAELFQMALPQEVKLDYYAMEEPWTLQQNPYTVAPEGSPVEVARQAMDLINIH